ncbi:MAG: SsrA-binding protein SmpB [Bacteroidetes bacterium]|nr:SsrA-binding protein SmpB [Bacteroidota bacterium]
MAEQKKINILNKKASFEYQIHSKYNAGIVLSGTEVKSIREGNVNISDAFCFVKQESDKTELYIKGMNVGIWKQGGHYNHEPFGVRKLLLKKIELRKLKNKASEKGFAIVPLRLYISERGFVKIEIAVGQGKKEFDKRESIKERDVERDMRRAIS